MRRMTGWVTAALAACALLGAASPTGAQVVVRDFAITAGAAMQGYRGNLSSVTLPVVDSTDQASAAAAELGARGKIFFLQSAERGFRVDFDGGLRQFATSGFELSDYAPREWVGRIDGIYSQRLSDLGTLHAAVGFKGRNVVDRPPMPLYLKAGYGAASGALLLQFQETQGVSFDMELMAERADYQAHELFPQLDLLDYRTSRVELGATMSHGWKLRFFGAYRFTQFPRQGSFDPADPHRRDRTVEAGAVWTIGRPVVAQLGVEGIFNRSNSNRPEYDAIRLRGQLAAPLPAELTVTLYASIVGKSYLHATEFARLVPGEEADNGSVVYAALNRRIAPNLDAQLRFGWTRAEIDVGGSDYQRYGVSILLNYWPAG